MGEGVLGSRVGGFHAAFSAFSSALTALLMLRARRGAVTLLHSAVPWKLLWRVGAEQVGAACSIMDAIARVLIDALQSPKSLSYLGRHRLGDSELVLTY